MLLGKIMKYLSTFLFLILWVCSTSAYSAGNQTNVSGSNTSIEGGYTGGETVRLLVNHPHVALSFVQSRSQAGKKVTDVHRDLLGDTDLNFVEVPDYNIDVLFLCLGHGESQVFLADKIFSPNNLKLSKSR